MDIRFESHLAEPDWLQERLGDPRIQVVDMRGHVITSTREDGFQTAEYRGARDEYLQSHIPGAVYLDWTADIVDLDDPVPAQAAGPDKTSAVFSAAGIGDETLVVAYDSHPASQFATRLWWMLNYYGHEQVRVLNGGWNRWMREARPVVSEEERPGPGVFTPRRNPALRKTWEEVRALLGTGARLIDARDEGQYSGRIRRGPRGGHIPGAVNLPRELLVTEDGRWRPAEDLEETFRSRGIRKDQEIVAYCNGGVAATSVLFALSMLGYGRFANYDGSWNEWGGRRDLPIE